jgi:hypothetical protein
VPCGRVYEPAEGRRVDEHTKWRQESAERKQRDDQDAIARIQNYPDPITRLLGAIATFVELEWVTIDGASRYLPTGQSQVAADGMIRKVYPNWPRQPSDEEVALSFARAAKSGGVEADDTCRWPEPAKGLLGGWRSEPGGGIKKKLGGPTAVWRIPSNRFIGSFLWLREDGLIAEDGRLYLGWQRVSSDKKRIHRMGELGLPALHYLGSRLERS